MKMYTLLIFCSSFRIKKNEHINSYKVPQFDFKNRQLESINLKPKRPSSKNKWQTEQQQNWAHNLTVEKIERESTPTLTERWINKREQRNPEFNPGMEREHVQNAT